MKSEERLEGRCTSENFVIQLISQHSLRAVGSMCVCWAYMSVLLCLFVRENLIFPICLTGAKTAAIGGACWPAQLWPHSPASSLRQRRKQTHTHTHTVEFLTASGCIPSVPDVQWSRFVWVKGHVSVEVWSALNAAPMSFRLDRVAWMT